MTTHALPTGPRALLARPFLRLALRLDALSCALNGAVYLALAGPLGDVFDLPPALLRGAGAALVAVAVLVWLASRPVRIAPAAAYAIVALNALWAAGSLVFAIAGWGSPSTAGTVWIVVQAVAVADLAALQLAGLRRGSR
jgi:hypothetical protein